MSSFVARALPAFLLGTLLSASPLPIYAGERAKSLGAHRPAPSTSEQIGLFAPRVRRATLTYLRLRLLELREQDLERARAAVERRLSVDELITGAPVAPRPRAGGRASAPRESTP